MTMYDPQQRIYCDYCDELLKFELVQTWDCACWKPIQQHQIEAEGWKCHPNGDHICPDCQETHKVKK